ncbi:VOC family protein [Sphingobium phenoxybenzoativorans]|uniref:VOC family protein n=1 Tax=Sphingobium phenoxybenzoativorans TaxID=1592790 RepID=A0A975K4D7_9SPHN|nr:VOC family protein [Sphingobium phenoxybenzoativorans]QUT04613.1 VOC family protein [Sphingobium phenoxybenzoativorans]
MTNVVRGVDHIGLTVPEIGPAESFLMEGMGAQFMYELLGAGMPPLKGPEVEKLVGIPEGAEINVARMYKLPTGPAIELFQYTLKDQRPALRVCDVGWQHVALYVDDIDAAAAKMVAAGGRQMAQPWDMIGPESGDGNRFCFIMAPFGAMIELVTYPEGQLYNKTTALRRWKPERQ